MIEQDQIVSAHLRRCKKYVALRRIFSTLMELSEVLLSGRGDYFRRRDKKKLLKVSKNVHQDFDKRV